MKFIISDKEEVQAAIREILLQPYRENIKKWEALVADAKSEPVKEYLDAMEKLLLKVEKLQKEGKKEAVSFINIHYLRASMLDDSFKLLLNAYSKRFYFDPVETENDWCPSLIKQFYCDDIKYLDEQIRRKNIIISFRELQEIRQKHYFDYLLHLPLLCQTQLARVMELDVFGRIIREEDFSVQFAEYMGPMIPLYIQIE